MRDFVMVAVNYKKPGLTALWRGMLRNEFRRKVKIKISGSHAQVLWFSIPLSSRDWEKCPTNLGLKPGCE